MYNTSVSVDRPQLFRYITNMPRKPHSTAIKIIYWHFVAASIVVSLGVSVFVNRHHRFDQLIVEAARKANLDPRLITAVVWKESRFDPHALEQAGGIGLMQVTPVAGREWAEATDRSFEVSDLFDPEINLAAGCWYLAQAIDRWDEKPDPLPYALAEYNAGHSNVLRWSKITDGNHQAFYNNIGYPTTKRYVEDILTRYRGRV